MDGNMEAKETNVDSQIAKEYLGEVVEPGKRLKKRELDSMNAATDKWFKRPEAQGFAKIRSAHVSHRWAHGPRGVIELDEVGENGKFLELLFYYRRKVIGYNVVAVWTLDPREKIWDINEGPTTSQSLEPS